MSRPGTAPLRRAAGVLAACVLAAALAGCGAGVIPAIRSEPERLEQGRLAVERGEYNIALELLRSYIANNAGGAEVDRAIYLLGQAYLGTREWSAAQFEFERLMRDYPESDSSASAGFRVGEALWGQARPPDFDQEHTRKALDQWQAYLRGHPGHWLNAEAERRVQVARTRLATKDVRTGNLYLKQRLAAPARTYFKRVVDEYTDTALLGDALIGLALADGLERRYDEAIAALRHIEAQHPGTPLAERAAHERSRLEKKRS